ncbi:MAG: hypothetical protein VKK04_04955 [Synechococcales bacterium]|nr:hypothetical protein [Synechococcales bacterium]
MAKPPGARPARDTASPERVKLTYNAAKSSQAGVVLDYLLKNDCFDSRQGRDKVIDALSAFYRPAAEERRGQLSEEELRQVAEYCVEVLAKQIETLCESYSLESPLKSAVEPQDSDEPEEPTGRLEVVLAEGLRAIANAITTGNRPIKHSSREMFDDSAIDDGDIDAEDDAVASFDADQGVEMDGTELGDLDQLVEPHDVVVPEETTVHFTA